MLETYLWKVEEMNLGTVAVTSPLLRLTMVCVIRAVTLYLCLSRFHSFKEFSLCNCSQSSYFQVQTFSEPHFEGIPCSSNILCKMPVTVAGRNGTRLMWFTALFCFLDLGALRSENCVSRLSLNPTAV